MQNPASCLSRDLPATATTLEALRGNLQAVQRRIAESASRAGRVPADVRLLPVSKTVPLERIRLAIESGCAEFGENRVQEAVRKHEEIADDRIAWSVVGHLQTNKARDAVAFAREIQSVDSARLAELIDRRAVAAGRRVQVWAQVNTSGEPSKFGVAPPELRGLLRTLRDLDGVEIGGLMTLAVFSPDRDRVRGCFQLLRRLRDQVRDEDPDLVGRGGLSMGMSSDFDVAIEEGATCVRIGQAIFGRRATPDSAYWPEPTADDRRQP